MPLERDGWRRVYSVLAKIDITPAEEPGQSCRTFWTKVNAAVTDAGLLFRPNRFPKAFVHLQFVSKQ